MADKKLNIKVSTTGAGKAKQQVSGLNGAISKMGKAVGIASAAYFGARGLISGFSSVIRLAGEQEQAEKKLEVSLGHTSKALLDHASALQKMTTFGDEAIIGVEASLAAFIKDEEQIKKATEATLDMAVAMGMDLKAAGDLVAKTLGSSTNAMSRYGIQVEGAVGSTERLESLTNNVAELFGGQASAQAETMAGSIDQMKNAVGDAGEALGTLLSPAVIQISQVLKTFAEDAVGFIDWLDGINTNEEILKNFNEQTAFAKETLKEYSESLNITTDDSKSLSENLSNLVDQAEEMNEKETFKGVAFSESARAMRDAKDAIILYEAALSAYKDTALPLVDKPIVIVPSAQAELLGDVIIDMDIMNDLMNETFDIGNKVEEQKKKQLQLDLRSAALSGQSAIEAMKSVVRAETMEAVAGYLASVLKTVPFPANLMLAAAGGGVVAGLMDKAMGAIPNQFATGADFITSGATPMLVGESGPERVSVTPLTPGMNQNGPGGITLNIHGGIVDQSYVQNELIPALNKATSMGSGLA